MNRQVTRYGIILALLMVALGAYTGDKGGAAEMMLAVACLHMKTSR